MVLKFIINKSSSKWYNIIQKRRKAMLKIGENECKMMKTGDSINR